MDGSRQKRLARWRQYALWGSLAAATVVLSACGTISPGGSGKSGSAAAKVKGGGGYYLDDGPEANPPANLMETPDAVPKIEPILPSTAKAYTVMGKTYYPLPLGKPYDETGIGSWYGKRYNGKPTSSGERYDMYAMTAASPVLPIPSYARVTNLSNGRQVIVRINDRGPFLSDRIIDLSYTAAVKLGYLDSGSSRLRVEHLLPVEIARMEKGGSKPVLAVAQVEPPAPALPEQPVPPEIAYMLQNDALLTNDKPAPSVPVGGTSFFLQFGAYAQSGNAESVRADLLRSWEKTLPTPEVSFTDGFFRLRSGPFATREAADAAVQLVRAQDNIRAILVER